jgi:hypothetical protein
LRSYPGFGRQSCLRNPNGVVSRCAHRATKPRWGNGWRRAVPRPRAAAARQPWAMRRNRFAVFHAAPLQNAQLQNSRVGLMCVDTPDSPRYPTRRGWSSQPVRNACAKCVRRGCRAVGKTPNVPGDLDRDVAQDSGQIMGGQNHGPLHHFALHDFAGNDKGISLKTGTTFRSTPCPADRNVCPTISGRTRIRLQLRPYGAPAGRSAAARPSSRLPGASHVPKIRPTRVQPP